MVVGSPDCGRGPQLSDRITAVPLLLLLTILLATQLTDPHATTAASVVLEQKTIERQQKQIAELQARVAALEAQLIGLGIEPLPATRPAVAPARPRRIVFIRTHGGKRTAEEIIASIDSLEADQYFNVINVLQDRVTPFRKLLAPAVDVNKKAVREFVPAEINLWGDWLMAVSVAMDTRPDVIWIVGNIDAKDHELAMRTLARLTMGASTRINTTVRISDLGNEPRNHHLSWRIAKAYGGKCIGPDGQEIAEPAVPVKRELPKDPPPATKPSVLGP